MMMIYWSTKHWLSLIDWKLLCCTVTNTNKTKYTGLYIDDEWMDGWSVHLSKSSLNNNELITCEKFNMCRHFIFFYFPKDWFWQNHRSVKCQWIFLHFSLIIKINYLQFGFLVPICPYVCLTVYMSLYLYLFSSCSLFLCLFSSSVFSVFFLFLFCCVFHLNQ